MATARLSREDASEFDNATRKAAVKQRDSYWRFSMEIADPAAKGAAYALHILRRMVEMRKDSPAGFGGDAFLNETPEVVVVKGVMKGVRH